MPPRKKAEPLDTPIPPPAKTIEGRNDQLIEAAFHLVEQRIHQGTASAQETVHFLKMGHPQQRLVEEKLMQENIVLQARVKEMEGRTSGEEMYKRALDAFRGYSGQVPVDPEAEEYEEF